MRICVEDFSSIGENSFFTIYTQCCRITFIRLRTFYRACLIKETKRRIVGSSFRTAGETDVVILYHRCAKGFFLPIRIYIADKSRIGWIIARCDAKARIQLSLVGDFSITFGVCQVPFLSNILNADIAVVANS